MINNVYKKAEMWESLQSLIKVSSKDGAAKGIKLDLFEKNRYDIS